MGLREIHKNLPVQVEQMMHPEEPEIFYIFA